MEDLTKGLIEEVEAEEIPSFLIDDQWYGVDYKPSMLNFDDAMEFPEYTIRFNGAKIAPVTGVICVSGQSGNGKTQTTTLVMACYLGADIPGIELIWERESIRVLYCDTEMEKGNTQLVVARVAKLCGKDVSELKQNFRVLRLRDEEDHVMIWKKILKTIYEEKPDVVMLDGMLDIIGDFNDNKEAHTIIRKIMKLADHYEIPLWTVMHQNPGSTKMVGHEGSFLERKSTLVMYPVKVEDDAASGRYHFEVKQGKQRGEDIKPLSFHMEFFTLPDGKTNAYPCVITNQPEVETMAEKVDIMQMSRDEIKQFFIATITSREGITTRALRESVKLEYKVGSTKADAFMLRAEKEKVIKRDEKTKAYFLYDESTEQSEVPF